ncbi:MAG: discoidin domain-containing protein, partial [Phocaeicola sp.]|nr:discoidin domain-containing protein [Phocaeicola sp.]
MKQFLSAQFWFLLSGLAILGGCTPQKTETSALPESYTRGIGMYPGDLKEYMAPKMEKDFTYRNIALHRAVYQSSSYDFNLTSQLVTDGILCEKEPNILIARTPDGELPKREKEWAIDAGEYTRNILMGEDTFIEYEWTDQTIPAQGITIKGSLAYDAEKAINGYKILVQTSADGTDWEEAAKIESSGLPGEATSWKAHSDPNKTTEQATLPTRSLNMDIDLKVTKPFKKFKLSMQMDGAAHWTFTEIQFKDKQQQVMNTLPSQIFNSAWMSADGNEQWVYVDLGTTATFDLIKLYWLHKPVKAQVETSDDAENWILLSELPNDKNLKD